MESTVVSNVPTKKKVALWLLISPTSLCIATFVIFILINFFTTLLTPMVPDTEQMTMPIGLVISNVMLFAIGVVSATALLPGLIIGIFLLWNKDASHA